MKISKQIMLLFLAIIGVNNIHAQETESADTSSASKKLPISYGIGAGFFNYRGDIGSVKDLGTTENFEPGFYASAEYLFVNTVGVNLTGSYGHISKNERSSNSNRNFKSSLINIDLTAAFHFANGFILSENYPIDPFIASGISYSIFDPKADLVDASGNTYNYWSDGSIRDIGEREPNAINAVEIQRDYDYETDLNSPGETKSAFLIPVVFGCNFTINPYLNAQLKQSIYFSLSDNIDGHVAGVANDVVFYSSLGFNFKPAGLTKRDKTSEDAYNAIDFVSLLQSDGDADGVLDIDDWCQETDEGVKVDKHGCPEDTDNDGIADYKDKQVDTKDVALKIDSNGVAISDSIVALQALDSVVTLREELCQFYPSMCQGDETDIEFQLLNTGKADKSLINSKVEVSKRPIEEIKKLTDFNKNGKIDAKEIYESIDKYFDGKLDLNLGDIHKLIDYFFEQ